MNKNYNQILLHIVILLLAASCSKKDDLINITQNLESFDTITINHTFNIYLIEDSVFEIEITAYEQHFNNIDFNIKNNCLVINDNTPLKFTSPTKNKVDIYIKSKPLSRINVNKTCNITTINPITSKHFGLVLASKSNQANLKLNCKNFYYWNNFPCGGKLTLSGECYSLKIWNCGLMVVDAEKLRSYNSLIENNSKGYCSTTTTNKLEYSISNVGNIYTHFPSSEVIKKEQNSSGRLIKSY